MSPLDDIRGLIEQSPQGDLDAMEKARARLASLMVPPDSLGRLGELAVWMARWQGRCPPRIANPMVAVFASSHGIAQHQVSPDPMEATPKIVDLLRTGNAATNHIAASAGAGMRLFEMALDQPTADISEGPAMTEKECAATIAFGMEAIAEKPDILALGETGVGGATVAAAVACALHGGNAQYWVRAGDWISPDALQRRIDVVERALLLHRGHLSDPLEILHRLGGRELAALVGAIIAARSQGIPVILDVFSSTVAAAVVHAIKPGAADHCIAGHLSSEPAHLAMLDRLGQKPLLDMGLRMTEGAGAAVCVPLLKAACDALSGVATSEETGWTRG